METKKHLKKDVKTKHTLFLQIGMVLSISACLWAFSWQRTLHEDILPQLDNDDEITLVNIPSTKIETDKPTQEAPKPPSHSLDNIEVVEDEIEVGEEEITEPEPEIIPIPMDIGPEDLGIPGPITQELEYFPLIAPIYPGGEAAQKEYLQKVVDFTNDGYYSGQKNVVVISFRVETDGSITSLKVLSTFDVIAAEEVIEAFSKMPKWIPGKNRQGQIAPVLVKMPVYFDFR